jgi:hypothetical protein
MRSTDFWWSYIWVKASIWFTVSCHMVRRCHVFGIAIAQPPIVYRNITRVHNSLSFACEVAESNFVDIQLALTTFRIVFMGCWNTDSERVSEEYYWGAGFKLNFLNQFISGTNLFLSMHHLTQPFFDLLKYCRITEWVSIHSLSCGIRPGQCIITFDHAHGQ